MADASWLADQYLGERSGDATREEVLEALRRHVLKSVVISVELPGGRDLLHVWGVLVEGSQDSETWETAETFAVVSAGLDAQQWHDPDRVGIACCNLQVPEDGLERYALRFAWPHEGYRFNLDGGIKLAVVLWPTRIHPYQILQRGFGGR